MSRVLIVDDDADLGWLLQTFMQLAGHATAFAADGAEGFRKVDEFCPEVVLLDVEMPTLDGPGLMAQMLIADCGRENIPVILLSGVVGLSHVAARVGTPYYLEKPVTADQLERMVELVLAERRPPRPRHGEDQCA